MSVYALAAAEDALASMTTDDREAVVESLKALTPDDGVPLPFGDKDYKAAVMPNGWIAVFRELRTGELGIRRRDNAIAIFDLLSPESALVSANGVF